MLAVPGIDTLRAGDPRFTQECTPQEKTEAIVTGTQDLSSIDVSIRFYLETCQESTSLGRVLSSGV